MKLVDPTTTLDLAFKHPRCPYCHADVRPDDADKRPCLGCMAWHHAECLSANRRCAACDAPVKPGGRRRRRKRAGKHAQGAPRRSVPLVEAMLPTRRQALSQLVLLPFVVLAVAIAGRAAAGLLSVVGAFVLVPGTVAWFALLRTRPRVAPRPDTPTTTRRRPSGESQRTVRPRTSAVRAALGLCFGGLVGWEGAQLLARAVGTGWLARDPDAYTAFMTRPSTLALFGLVALLLGAVTAALVYRD